MHSLFLGVPFSWYVTIVGIYGLIIGSFLNVVIYRFHTGKSLSGKSHCLSCGKPLKPYDLVPLFSYVFLRGRCRACGSYVPIRYFIVEVSTALLFVLSAVAAQTVLELLFLLTFVSIAVVVVVYDMRHFIIPDMLTALLGVLALVRLAVLWWQGTTLVGTAIAVGAAFAAAAFFYLLWKVSHGQWIGFGDVKLVFPLGLLVGPTLVFSLVVYSFWIGAVISLLLVGLAKLQRGKLRLHLGMRNLTIKSVVPFAPFLIAACVLILFSHSNVLDLFTFIY